MRHRPFNSSRCLTMNTYYDRSISPMFKYMKSPLSIKSQHFVEKLFTVNSHKRALSTMNKKVLPKRSIKSIIFISNKENKERKKAIQKDKEVKNIIKEKMLLPSIKKYHNITMTTQGNSFISQSIKTEENSKNELKDKVGDIKKMNNKKLSCVNMIPKKLSRNSTLSIPITYRSKSKVSVPKITIPSFFPTKIKVEKHHSSLIDEYVCKTYPYNNTSVSLHLSLTSIFKIISFSIFGICTGEGVNAYLVASIAKANLISYWTTLITYDISYQPTSDEIYSSISNNNFELIKSVYERVAQDIETSLAGESKNFSCGLLFVIGENVIFSNKGSKVSTITITKVYKDHIEYVKSNKISNDKEDIIADMKYNRDMKYAVMSNGEFITSQLKWRNIVTVIANERKKLDEKSVSLQEKLKIIDDYNRRTGKEESYSIVIVRFVQ